METRFAPVFEVLGLVLLRKGGLISRCHQHVPGTSWYIMVHQGTSRYIKAMHLEIDLLKNSHTQEPAATFLCTFFPPSLIFWANSSLSVYLSYPHPLKISPPFCLPG